ncbi:MAG TPA: serine--tRNA ligase, partial [Blastocatellia bacterium]|nr:serine--tRNA ligase [Blastocatellia bacterium]
MLDINYVRANLEAVRKKLEDRGFPVSALDRFSELDERRRLLIRTRDELNARRNSESQEIGRLIKAGQREEADSRRAAVRDLGDNITSTEMELAEVEALLADLMTGIPNLAHESVPVGADETANLEIKRWGEPRNFDFEPLDHVDLATRLGILDLERAARIAGARFAILTGAGARLERALINFCLDLHTKRHGYTEVVPPFIANSNALFGTGQLPK